jgi:hypothetical protein
VSRSFEIEHRQREDDGYLSGGFRKTFLANLLVQCPLPHPLTGGISGRARPSPRRESLGRYLAALRGREEGVAEGAWDIAVPHEAEKKVLKRRGGVSWLKQRM